MQTRTDAGAPAERVPSAAWLAAGLASGASLLHWISTGSATHSWSAEAVVSLLAGAGLMGLALVLAARPWSLRQARAVYLIGALGTTVVLAAFVLPVALALVLPQPSGTGHGGHAAGGDGIAGIDGIRMAAEGALIGVLLWLYRRPGGQAVPGAR